jgi:hypothetical protein
MGSTGRNFEVFPRLSATMRDRKGRLPVVCLLLVARYGPGEQLSGIAVK